MEYKYLDPAENVSLPKPQMYAGLYSPYASLPHHQSRWSKNYRGEHIPPDAVAYASQYFELARSHIPTSIRPGNNTMVFNPYKHYKDDLNMLCYGQ